MDDSFYYFFSATPQVLAAILALFGVFVIFKIENLKSDLIGIGRFLISNVENYSDQNDTFLGFQIKAQVALSIQNKDINGLKATFDIFKNKANYFYQNFYKLYNSFQSLKKNTIIWSIITACIIVICLTILSQGDYFVNHTCFLSILFWIVIGLIIACFTGLIYILIKSLSES